MCAEGYLSSRQGRGYFVERLQGFGFDGQAQPSIAQSALRATLAAREDPVAYDFDYNSVYSSSLPWPRWKRCLQAATVMHETGDVLSYEDKKGNLYLRNVLCEFLMRYRGIHCEPDQIVVCSSSQHAMAIAASLFDPETQGIIMEDPGSLSMRKLFVDRGFSVESIPVGSDGVQADKLANIPGDVLYLSPSHNFPTGYTTSVENRRAIIAWSCGEAGSASWVDGLADQAERAHGRYVIENDRDFEFRSTSAPIPSIKSLDVGDRVLHIGTLSRLLSPSMRCAYLVLPRRLLARFENVYRFFFSMLPTYHQMAIAMMIEKGALDKHFSQLRKENNKRHLLLQRCIVRYLKDRVIVASNPQGLYVMVHVKCCDDPHKLQQFLLKRSIRVRPVVDYCHDGEGEYRNAFLLGYSVMPEEKIPEACKALAAALDAYEKL